MRKKFPFDRARFRRLASYLTRRIGDREAFDDIGLHKALWLADSRMFMLHAQPISGAVYLRGENGPRAQRVGAILGEIRRAKPPAAPEPGPLTPNERDSAEWALRHLTDPRCAQIWQIAAVGEEIPYGALFAIRMRRPNEGELEWARRAAELGLAVDE